MLYLLLAYAALPVQGAVMKPAGKARGWCCAAAALCCLLAVAGCLLWTPTHYDTLYGLQGRYFLPVLPLLLLMLLTGVRVSPALLLLPLMIALSFLFALGVTLVMATLNVFFRDTRFLWSVISLLWTYATPIFYPDTIWPEGLRGIFHLHKITSTKENG